MMNMKFRMNGIVFTGNKLVDKSISKDCDIFDTSTLLAKKINLYFKPDKNRKNTSPHAN